MKNINFTEWYADRIESEDTGKMGGEMKDVYQEDHTLQQLDMMVTRLEGMFSGIPAARRAKVTEWLLSQLKERLDG